MLTLQSYAPAGSGASAPYCLVTAINGIPVISSTALAEGLGIAHRALIATIRKHLASVERFGRVLFQKAPLKTNGGTQLITQVHLNENQALFVGSLSDNSAQVVEFKVRLIEEFDKVRKTLVHVPQAGLVKLVNTLTEKVISLEGTISNMHKAWGNPYVYQATVRETGRQETALKRERALAIISTRARYSLTAKPEDFLIGFGKAYNVNVCEVEQLPNETRFDALIRKGYIDQLLEYLTL